MYAFIVNPHSRSGLGIRVWRCLEPLLKEQQVEYRVCMTRYPEHASEFARELSGTYEPLTLIALGGDGSINEVINGIADLSNVTFGYIPIGSGNDFARSMKLGKDPREMLERILHPTAFTWIDIGRIRFGQNHRRFAVSSGIGFDAEVCLKNTARGLKKWLNRLKLGKLSYAGTAIRLLISLRPASATLTLDNGERKTFQKVFFATAMNQKYEGGGFKFCPKADPSDGLLDVILIADMSKWKALFLLPTAFAGLHIFFRGVHTYTCKKAEFSCSAPLAVHTDGEPVSRETSVTFELEEQKLKFIHF